MLRPDKYNNTRPYEPYLQGAKSPVEPVMALLVPYREVLKGKVLILGYRHFLSGSATYCSIY